MSVKKLLLYGGAFDPPHLGHTRLLETAVNAVKPDRIIVMPSAHSPHKRTAGASFAERCDMCRLAFGNTGVTISGFENRSRKRSYTVRTLRYLHRRFPDYKIYLVLGSDALCIFLHRWKQSGKILSLATLVSARRTDADDGEFDRAVGELAVAGHAPVVLDMKPVEVSSSDFRAEHYDMDAVCGAVAEYIERHHLYKR